MAVFLDSKAADFETRFVALLGAKREAAADVDTAVAEIIADVRARGDAALIDYSKRFDRVDLAARGIAITGKEIDAAVAAAFADAKAIGGDAVVLLSPACASFDQFPDFEVRGDAFRAAVQGLLDMPLKGATG